MRRYQSCFALLCTTLSDMCFGSVPRINAASFFFIQWHHHQSLSFCLFLLLLSDVCTCCSSVRDAHNLTLTRMSFFPNNPIAISTGRRAARSGSKEACIRAQFMHMMCLQLHSSPRRSSTRQVPRLRAAVRSTLAEGAMVMRMPVVVVRDEVTVHRSSQCRLKNSSIFSSCNASCLSS